LTDYCIGTGGWAYFKVPGLRSLVAYSRLFNFVEVNSTFYRIPSLKAVESWRRMVSPEFEFSVRCNKIVTHEQQFKSDERTLETFQNMITICKILRAEILHLQTPVTFEPNRINANLVDSFLTSVDLQGVRLAYEARGFNQRLCPEFVEIMQNYNMVHSVDLTKGEDPEYDSDILYSRLFGKGVQNIYQPTDQELKQIDDRAKAKPHNKVVVSFHFIRMYKDAARLKTYLETGKFPKVTRFTGFKSLEEILKEDAQFPTTKQQLLQHQGWKLIDLTPDERVRANDLLQKLPEKTYNNINDIIQAL
jgi:uncharacterized protein YecE (DUF72 family)